MFLSACGGGKSKDPVPPNPDPEPTGSQKISLDVRNISGLPIDKKVSLTFDGVALLNAQDATVTALDLETGETSIELHTASLIDAKDLKILVKAAGYVDTGVTLQLDKEQESYTSNIYLIPEKSGKVKDGIYTQIDENLTDIGTDGKVNKALTLTLQESATTPKIEVSIPKGTTLTAEDGTPVVPTSAIIVRFDPTQANVLDAYPGGLNVIADVSGTMEQVDFKSAGFASIMLKDSEGKKVKKFDKDITIAMQFKKGITNGEGVVVEVGDSVPIWSYNEDKGTWVYEEDGIVKDLNTSDNLYDVVYKTNHLTYFNLDWNSDVCDAHIELTDSGNVLQNNKLKVILKLKDYNVERSFFYSGDGFINLSRIPDSRNWEIEFYDLFTGEKIDSKVSNLSICGDHTISVNKPSVGDIPVTKTEIEVNLSCPSGAAIPQLGAAPFPLDVYIMDRSNFLLEYGLAINEPLDFRTYDDGVLKIYDLPRTDFGKTLDVNVFPADKHRDIINLALLNTPGPFTITIGKDKDENSINLVLPDDYCNAGGVEESKIDATVSCPSGNIPNTQSQTLPFIGSVLATKSTDNTRTVFASMENGSVLIELLKGTEYTLALAHADQTIAQNITNNSEELITAGEDKTFSFLLSDAYCDGNVEDLTYTYIRDGLTITETPFINNTGSIDFKDYLSPNISTQLRYIEYSKSHFLPNQPESEAPQTNDVTVNGNQITYNESDFDKTEFTIQEDRVKVVEYDKDDVDSDFTKERDSFYGRLYNPGGTLYKTSIVGSNTLQNGTDSFTYDMNFQQLCVIEEKLNTFSQRIYSYTGDIIRVKCSTTGTWAVTNNTTSETTTHPINDSEVIYFKKGVGIIAEIENSCIPDGQFFADNTTGCTVNDYNHKFFVEASPPL